MDEVADIFTFLSGGLVDEIEISNWLVGGMLMGVSTDDSEGKSKYVSDAGFCPKMDRKDVF